MSKALDRLRAHSGAGERRSVEVPELDGEKVFFSRLTGAIHGKVEEREPSNAIDRNVLLLIFMAEYENGDKVFQPGDRMELMNTIEWSAISRLINFMWEPNFDDGDEAEELIASDPPLPSD